MATELLCDTKRWDVRDWTSHEDDSTRRVPLFGVQMDPLSLAEAVTRIMLWIEGPVAPCRYVVTPNVDHVVLLQSREDLRQAYRQADLVLADGAPVVAVARWLGKPLPERVAGSDLVPALFQATSVDRPISVFLLGGAPGVPERAAQQMAQRWPHATVVGTYSPPLGFEHQPDECQEIVRRIAQQSVDVLVVGLGAPKQELWVQAHQDQLNAKVALCVGATIDFLAGEKKRAPRWMQRLGMEWLHRVASEPRRLMRRYLRDAVAFPRLVWREFMQDRIA